MVPGYRSETRLSMRVLSSARSFPGLQQRTNNSKDSSKMVTFENPRQFGGGGGGGGMLVERILQLYGVFFIKFFVLIYAFIPWKHVHDLRMRPRRSDYILVTFYRDPLCG